MAKYIVAFIVLVSLSAFFSGSEMSFSSANKRRLDDYTDKSYKDIKKAKRALYILDHFDYALTAILIGNNCVNIITSSLASAAAILFFGEQWTWAATLLVTVVVIMFGETLPKIITKASPTSWAERLAVPNYVLIQVLKPLVFLISRLTDLMVGLLGRETGDESEHTIEELKSTIEAAEEEDIINEDRSELVQNAISFGEVSVKDLMVARVDIEAVDIDASPDEIRYSVEHAAHSRLPFYKDSLDNIVGILHLNRYYRELLTDDEPDIAGMLLEPVYLYKTTKLPVALDRMRHSREHIAIVTDEYGGTMGTVSMEDIIEEIVGDIWDEKDNVEEDMVQTSDDTYELDGGMSIHDMLEELGIDEDDFPYDSDTVGGWVLEMTDTFPEAGSGFVYGDYAVTVTEADGRRVMRVKLKRLPAADTGDAPEEK